MKSRWVGEVFETGLMILEVLLKKNVSLAIRGLSK